MHGNKECAYDKSDSCCHLHEDYPPGVNSSLISDVSWRTIVTPRSRDHPSLTRKYLPALWINRRRPEYRNLYAELLVVILVTVTPSALMPRDFRLKTVTAGRLGRF